jgi:hypothetical protein
MISLSCGDVVVGRPLADQSDDAALTVHAASKSYSLMASRSAPGCRRPKEHRGELGRPNRAEPTTLGVQIYASQRMFPVPTQADREVAAAGAAAKIRSRSRSRWGKEHS